MERRIPPANLRYSSSKDNTPPERQKTTIGLVAIIMEVLKEHFRNNSTDFPLSDNSVDSKISIEQAHAFDASKIQTRPAVYIKRGDLQYQRISVGSLQSVNPKDATYNFIEEVSGYITCFCIAMNGGEVERIAQEVKDVLQVFQYLIANDFNFLTFKIQSVGQVGRLEEFTEAYTVPITVVFVAPEQWTLNLESTKLKTIRQVINADSIIDITM